MDAAAAKVEAFVNEFNAAYTAWTNAVQAQSRQSPAAQAATEDVVHRWRLYNEMLKARSITDMNNASSMSTLENLVAQISEDRITLARLRGEAATRTDQADSLNPRITNSPYTNILGKMIQPGTWNALLAASVLFGALTLVLTGLLIWAMVRSGQGAKFSLPQVSPQTTAQVSVGGGGGRLHR